MIPVLRLFVKKEMQRLPGKDLAREEIHFLRKDMQSVH